MPHTNPLLLFQFQYSFSIYDILQQLLLLYHLCFILKPGSDEANMTMNPREKDLGAKKEDEDHKFPLMSTSTPSSSRQWSSSFKNPRIVRVSRNFGGKDRHSKVCTVRGLRDRRIRLSVPTAIQLYDLQDRLGLTQPSKVIDWLLDASTHEIDKLPPLPMIPTNFLNFHHPPTLNHELASPYNSNTSNVSEFLSRSERWNNNIGSSSSSSSHQQEGFGAHNFFPPNSDQFSVPDMPYTSNYFQPNLSLSQFGGGYSFSNRTDDQEQTPQAYTFPPYDHEHQFRQMNDDMQQNSVMMMPTTLHLINHSTGEQDKDDNITTS